MMLAGPPLGDRYRGRGPGCSEELTLLDDFIERRTG
jgi:hypothetical protein